MMIIKTNLSLKVVDYFRFYMEHIFEIIHIVGSFVLAISGALTAMKKKFDGFGVLIIAFVTAVGGGTLRDTLLAQREVFWFNQSEPLYAILVGAIIAVIFRSRLTFLYKPLLFFDAIGLGLFTITGVQIGIDYDLNLWSCIILGTITGTFGGIIRDILVNKIPIIFKREVYATISIAGGFVYYFLVKTSLPALWINLIPILLMIISRLIVVYFKISLPSLYSKSNKEL